MSTPTELAFQRIESVCQHLEGLRKLYVDHKDELPKMFSHLEGTTNLTDSMFNIIEDAYIKEDQS